MISIISPAKTLDFESDTSSIKNTVIKHRDFTDQLIQDLRLFSSDEIMELMNVSRKIADLNYYRFQNFSDQPQKQAIFAYKGDVYNNIDVQTFNDKDLKFAQDHLNIISGLYGLLKPLDKIKPYRLEMSTKLSKYNKSLSQLWRKEITSEINKTLKTQKTKFLINLASAEYSDAINRKTLEYPIVNVNFRQIKSGQQKNIGIQAKRARGMMTNHIIKNQIDHPNDLKAFNYQNYQFDNINSDNDNLFFIKKLTN